MELIYQSTIMKKLTKLVCVILLLFSVCQVAGCDKLSSLGKTKTEGEKTEAAEKENEEVTSDEKEERVSMAELMGGDGSDSDPKETEPLPDTILWFNATYAPLTYNNGWNGCLISISGLAMTDDSPTLERYSYYEMLQKVENGPYSLDWDMKL